MQDRKHMGPRRESQRRGRPLFQGQVEAGKLRSSEKERIERRGKARSGRKRAEQRFSKRTELSTESHVVEKHRKVPVSSGNMKCRRRQGDQSQGVGDGNQAAVGGGMNGGGVGGRDRRGSVEGTGQAGDRQWVRHEREVTEGSFLTATPVGGFCTERRVSSRETEGTGEESYHQGSRSPGRPQGMGLDEGGMLLPPTQEEGGT